MTITTFLVFDYKLIHKGELQEETPDDLVFSDIIFPKHIIPGYQFIQVDVPDDFNMAQYTFDGTQLVRIPDPEPEPDPVPAP